MAAVGQPPGGQVALADTVVGRSYSVRQGARTWRGTVTAKNQHSIAFRVFPEDEGIATARNVTLAPTSPAEVTEIDGPAGEGQAPPQGARRRRKSRRRSRARKTRRRN